MFFSISFIEDKELCDSLKVPDGFQLGSIVIGEFEELFESPLSFWSIGDYQKHWKRALERTVNGAAKSCLFTSMYDPPTANFLFWWPLYREGQIVYIQNQMLFLNKIDGALDPVNPYVHVPDRKVINKDGEKISEWNTTVEEISQFLETLKGE
jgi:hypothetical protein